MFSWKERHNLLLWNSLAAWHPTTLLMSHEHNSKLSRISSKSGFPLPCTRLRCKKRMRKTEPHFFPSTLSETSLWSGNGVGRGNILVCSRFIRLTTYFKKSVKTSLCHSNQLPLQSFGPQKILHLQQLKHSDERVWGIFSTETEMLERNIEKILLCGEDTLFLPVTQ